MIEIRFSHQKLHVVASRTNKYQVATTFCDDMQVPDNAAVGAGADKVFFEKLELNVRRHIYGEIAEAFELVSSEYAVATHIEQFTKGLWDAMARLDVTIREAMSGRPST